MSKYATNEKRPSRMFLNSITGGGSTEVTCNCGRRHYATKGFDYCDSQEDYEIALKTCLEEQKNDPDGVVIDYDDDCVYYKELGGQAFVVHCPCNGLRRYEDFIWGNRNSMREYYKFRVENEAKWSEAELIKNRLAGI